MRRRISIRCRVRPSIRRSVRRSVCPVLFLKVRILGASCAVYPALFYSFPLSFCCIRFVLFCDFLSSAFCRLFFKLLSSDSPVLHKMILSPNYHACVKSRNFLAAHWIEQRFLHCSTEFIIILTSSKNVLIFVLSLATIFIPSASPSPCIWTVASAWDIPSENS